jgi:hypothetical protein
MRKPFDRRTMAAAIATCERIGREWDRESRRRIAGRGTDDDWGAAADCANAARECARALARLELAAKGESPAASESA